MPQPIVSVSLHADTPYVSAAADQSVAAARSRHAVIALVVVVLLAWFASLELRGLFIPDEGRYAEIPREMLETGDWITPRLNGLKYFEKPPLQYWATAVSYEVFGFGDNEKYIGTVDESGVVQEVRQARNAGR